MSLPGGYTELEYIQSSGTQYVDTGFKPKQSTRIVMDLQLLSTAGVPYVFGTWAGGMSNCFSVYWWTNVHNSWGVDYGTQRAAISQTNWNKRLTVDLNQNVVTVDGVSYTLTTTTFAAANNLFLLALNSGSSVIQYTTAKVYGCKIYDNGTLVRDFIPCKNASGVIGLWDDVNSVFYQNAGSGAFTAGPEVRGTHKTLIGGTAYEVKSGKCLINGTAYAIQKGRTLINGTGYDIALVSGTPISALPVGSTVKIAVNGTLRDFLIVNQGIPQSSSLYDDSCNGTWLLMKDCYEQRQWHIVAYNKYANSDIHSYLNGTFLNLVDSKVQNIIKQVKIPYRTIGYGDNLSGANGLSCKIFLLSGYEIGWTYVEYLKDGARLSYFESGTGTSAVKKRIAYLNGTAVVWWLRSPYHGGDTNVHCIYSDGSELSTMANTTRGVRPAFVLPSETMVADDGTIVT